MLLEYHYFVNIYFDIVFFHSLLSDSNSLSLLWYVSLSQMKGESGKPFKTTQFHFTTWPDHGVPDYATPILGFHRRVKSQHKPSRGPLLVHCSAGVGRTGTYIALDNILDQIAAENVVGVSSTIVKARKQRMKMVQTQVSTRLDTEAYTSNCNSIHHKSGFECDVFFR